MSNSDMVQKKRGKDEARIVLTLNIKGDDPTKECVDLLREQFPRGILRETEEEMYDDFKDFVGEGFKVTKVAIEITK